jgi:hypothetical protein
MKIPSYSIERVTDDFSAAKLGDPRRTHRVQKVAARLVQAPSAPLPVALGTTAELEGAYRLMNNEHVTFDALMAAHAEATRERAELAKSVLVIHDTTPCTFPHVDPNELGYLTTGKPGFPLHLSLVLDAESWRRPLGVVHAEALYRPKPSANKDKSRKTAKKNNKAAHKGEREFDRWLRGMKASSKALGHCNQVVHVADCEADSYELMAGLMDSGDRFVIRVRVDDRRGREADAEQTESWSTIRQIAQSCEGVLERDVPLSRRKKHNLANQNKAHPPRKSRIAKLRFAATKVRIPRPHRLRDPFAKELEVNLVHVTEPHAPADQPPVDWLLYTTEPIETPEDVARVVDIYRSRWTIEEFNAALKTGCAYEARQFESRKALLTLLAISLPVACELLWLRSRARCTPEAPATEVLTPTQIQVIRALRPNALPKETTCRDALMAVAALGGHVKANGDPGWKVLYRGMTRLADSVTGWLAARQGQDL